MLLCMCVHMLTREWVKVKLIQIHKLSSGNKLHLNCSLPPISCCFETASLGTAWEPEIRLPFLKEKRSSHSSMAMNGISRKWDIPSMLSVQQEWNSILTRLFSFSLTHLTPSQTKKPFQQDLPPDDLTLKERESVNSSVLSNSLQPHGL